MQVSKAVVSTAGAYWLSMGVVDVGNLIGASGLLVDSVPSKAHCYPKQSINLSQLCVGRGLDSCI